jgi:AraC-like DNA-binding protein
LIVHLGQANKDKPVPAVQVHHVIRSASLRGFVELAHRYGLNVPLLMRQAGLPQGSLDHPDHPINLMAAQAVLELAAKASGIDSFGLRMAEGRKLSHLGLISLVLRNESTVRSALQALTRYLRLINASLLTRLEDFGQVVVIKEELLAGGQQSNRQSIELAVGVMHKILTELIGPDWRPQQVCFTHRPPLDRSAHHRFFGVKVQFNSPFNGLVCAAADLERPMATADPELAMLARQHLEEALKSHRDDMVETVSKLIAALLSGGRCTTDQVAQMLGVDRRTVHRALSRQGTTFSQVLSQVRSQFVEQQLMNSDKPLADIAQLLGFSSASALAHWFKAHYGCTVQQWKAQTQGVSDLQLGLASQAS